MERVFLSWGISAFVLFAIAALAGRTSKYKNICAVFIDFRGRYSLTRFQITMWTIIVLSLWCGVILARFFGKIPSPFEVAIPSQLLALMGISVGSTATSEAIKAGKDIKHENDGYIARVTGKKKGQEDKSIKAKFSQVYLAEEGEAGQNEEIDITKFQNFLLTLVLLFAYVAAAITFIAKTKLSCLNTLPVLDGTMLTLLGISHGGYIAGKLPDKKKPDEPNEQPSK